MAVNEISRGLVEQFGAEDPDVLAMLEDMRSSPAGDVMRRLRECGMYENDF